MIVFKRMHLIFSIIMLAAFSTVLFPPFFRIVNQIEPWIFGTPFVIFWIMFLNVFGTVGLLILWFLESKEYSSSE